MKHVRGFIALSGIVLGVTLLLVPKANGQTYTSLQAQIRDIREQIQEIDNTRLPIAAIVERLREGDYVMVRVEGSGRPRAVLADDYEIELLEALIDGEITEDEADRRRDASKKAVNDSIRSNTKILQQLDERKAGLKRELARLLAQFRQVTTVSGKTQANQTQGSAGKASKKGCVGWTGKWRGNFGDIWNATQTGNSLSATYEWKYSGTVSGTVDQKGELTGKFTQVGHPEAAFRSGKVKLRLSSDGDSWSGTWTDANGNPGGGTWSGTCIGASDPNIKN